MNSNYVRTEMQEDLFVSTLYLFDHLFGGKEPRGQTQEFQGGPERGYRDGTLPARLSARYSCWTRKCSLAMSRSASGSVNIQWNSPKRATTAATAIPSMPHQNTIPSSSRKSAVRKSQGQLTGQDLRRQD